MNSPARPDVDALLADLIDFVSRQQQRDIDPELRDAILNKIMVLPRATPAAEGADWHADFQARCRALGDAPPKPAPDAMRLCSCKASQRDGQHMIWCATLAAPVPSPDGAMQAMNEALARQYNIPDELWKGASKDNPLVPPSDAGAAESGADEREAAIEEIRQEVVLAIAFLTRDGGTDRITETVRQLIPRLANADAALRALRQPTHSSDGDSRG